MRILFFGSYDATVHPRVGVLIDGMRFGGDEVVECNLPLGRSTKDRVDLVASTTGRIGFIGRLLRVWWGLIVRSLRQPSPDVVVVGYMGQFDVLLARVRYPRTTIALDYLVSGADTAADRSVGSPIVHTVLRWLDRLALAASDLVIVDTADHLRRLPPSKRPDAVVVPIGATDEWFVEPRERSQGPLKVVFFGLFTPLQGAPTIGRAIADLARDPIEFTMIGRGQDYEACRAAVEESPSVEWLDWIPYEDLPDEIASHDVCLGIFGTSPKASRVVPTKVFQGAAAGCVILTSDTPVQRETLSDVAYFVASDDHQMLADALRTLAGSDDLYAKRVRSQTWAEHHFHAERVVVALGERLEALHCQ